MPSPGRRGGRDRAGPARRADDNRRALDAIGARARGFTYVVSVTGTTGERAGGSDGLARAARARSRRLACADCGRLRNLDARARARCRRRGRRRGHRRARGWCGPRRRARRPLARSSASSRPRSRRPAARERAGDSTVHFVADDLRSIDEAFSFSFATIRGSGFHAAVGRERDAVGRHVLEDLARAAATCSGDRSSSSGCRGPGLDGLVRRQVRQEIDAGHLAVA